MKDINYIHRDSWLRKMGFRNYKDYLQSKTWIKIRKDVADRDKRTCQKCGGPGEVVHHKNYFPSTMLGSRLDGLITLCHSCHAKIENKKHQIQSTSANFDKRVENLQVESTHHPNSILYAADCVKQLAKSLDTKTAKSAWRAGAKRRNIYGSWSKSNINFILKRITNKQDVLNEEQKYLMCEARRVTNMHPDQILDTCAKHTKSPKVSLKL